MHDCISITRPMPQGIHKKEIINMPILHCCVRVHEDLTCRVVHKEFIKESIGLVTATTWDSFSYHAPVKASELTDCVNTHPVNKSCSD